MKQLNKILAYSLVALLLGTVTMIAPLALLEPEANSLTSGSYDNEPSSQKSSEYTGNVNDSLSPLDSSSTLGAAESPSNLPQIGLLVIPGFLVAVGAFLFFKKRNY